MSKNTKTWLVTLAGVMFLALAVLARDLYFGSAGTINCEDGQRQTIDPRSFMTQYSRYAIGLDATVKNAMFSGKLDPVRVRELSDSLQHADEFRRYVVVGFNSCAITKAQYAQYGARVQAMDSLAQQIDHLVSQPTISTTAHVQLTDLVAKYTQLAQQLAAP